MVIIYYISDAYSFIHWINEKDGDGQPNTEYYDDVDDNDEFECWSRRKDDFNLVRIWTWCAYERITTQFMKLQDEINDVKNDYDHVVSWVGLFFPLSSSARYYDYYYDSMYRYAAHRIHTCVLRSDRPTDKHRFIICVCLWYFIFVMLLL